MSIETSIDQLTAETTSLLDVCTNLKNGIQQQIADAVVVSENAAIVPMITIATNLINTQTMLIQHI